jgi:hypothetical protein
MTRRRYDQRTIKDAAVRVGLLCQSNQAVLITLDLITDELSVDHCYIDPSAARAYSNFVTNQGVVARVK